MQTIMTIGRMSGTAVAVLMFIALPLASAQAADLDYGWVDTGYYDVYEPSYDYYDYDWVDTGYYDVYEPTYDDYSWVDTGYYDVYEPSYDDYGWVDTGYYDVYEPSYNYGYSNSNAHASAYASASSHSYGNSYTYNYNNDNGCKKNCNPPPQPKPKPVCALDISPSRVNYGEDATIHWTSENATSATLTNFGSVSTGGSRDIENIRSDKTFTLTVKGPGGTATCSDSIQVEEEEKDALECKLRASDTSIDRGDSVKITWSSDGADYGRISPTIGEVDEDGSETVRPREDTTYKGTFYNDDGDKVTCSVKVNVDDEPVYIPPHTPYVTLSAVPYTGFELGPVGTVIYWSLLSLWCLIAAYLIAVKKAHVGIARQINSFLFGSNEVAVSVTSVAVAHTAHATHTNDHAVHGDTTDEFVLSQLNRGRHAH